MNIEITENIILGSIIYALSNHFGDKYHYYDEEIEQGFEKPSFHVQKIDDNSKKGYTGHQYHLTDDTYRYEIKYFTDNKNNKVKDINDKIDELKQLFRYLEIVNIDGDKVYSKYNRINNIEVTIVDKVLHFDIVFPMRTIQYLDMDKVKTNYLDKHIINKEKEDM